MLGSINMYLHGNGGFLVLSLLLAIISFLPLPIVSATPTMKRDVTVPVPIRVITHNIRYATKSPGRGEKPWSERKPLLVNELRYHTRHNPESFICLQEVLNGQLVDILDGLNNSTSTQEWTSIGVGRDDGRQSGEYSPILFRPSVWNLVSFKTFWLSETPDKVGSVGWDAALPRIVTVGLFQHKQNGRKVRGACTHFDNQGVVARKQSAGLIVKLVGEWEKDGQENVPVFVAGDLNSQPEEEAYQVFNGAGSPLKDTRDLVEEKKRYGNKNTFTGFEGKSGDLSLIDFVFVRKERWTVDGYAVLENKFEDGVYDSDHRAVVADLVLGS